MNLIKKLFLDWRIWCLIFFLQLPSLRPLFKYLPEKFYFLIPIYFLLVFLFYFFIFFPVTIPNKIQKLFSSNYVTFILVAILLIINAILYPYADDLKVIMRGADQDDALIIAGTRLMKGLDPYGETTYLGGLISPGPGLVILMLPFILTKTYFAATPIFILFYSLFLKKILKNNYYPNLFILILISSIFFWEQMTLGSDFIIIGILLVTIIILIFFHHNKSRLKNISLALITALISSSRIIYLYIIPLLGSFMFKQNKREGLNFTFLSLLFFLVIHVYFFVRGQGIWSTLHIINKMNLIFEKPFFLFPVISIFILLTFITIIKLKNEILSWLFYFLLWILTPLFLVSLVSLFQNGFQFKLWEGASFLTIPLPILATVVIFSLKKRKM